MPVSNSPVKMSARFFEVNKELFLCLLVVFHVVASNAFALKETAFGRFDLSASLSAEYDSRVFGISSQSLQGIRTSGTPGVAVDEIESEDDLILRFTPAIHYTKKLRWFTFSGSVGVQLAQFVKNDKKSYVQPTSTFSIDFDETLSKKKRISNNAKIRFDMTFDLGQKVEASVLEQDLVSYSYFVIGSNVRYNHSSKFGLGAGTSYAYRNYQAGVTGGQSDAPYNDLATIPIYARAFYIYSEKLDFFTEYNFSRSRDMSGSGGSSLTDGATHGVSFGAQGELSPKLSGNAKIGFVRQVYDSGFSGQSTLSLGSGLQWTLNRKTSMGFDLNRGFSPSAQGYTMLNTTGRLSLNHRFTDDVSGTAYVSYGTTDYTYASGTSSSLRSNSLDNIGFGTNLTKTLSKHFTTSGGYSFSHFARESESYGRHLVRVDLNGRF